MTRRWMTVPQAARLCGVPTGLLRAWLKEDRLGPEGDRVRTESLRACLRMRELPVPPGIEDGPLMVVADDDPDAAGLVADMLRARWPRATIRTAHDGRKALALLLELKPDLLVTDWQMPGRTGLDLCRLVRDHRELASVKVLAITGYHSAHSSAVLLGSGADGYLPKPFDAEELQAAVERLIGDQKEPWRRPASSRA